MLEFEGHLSMITIRRFIIDRESILSFGSPLSRIVSHGFVSIVYFGKQNISG